MIYGSYLYDMQDLCSALDRLGFSYTAYGQALSEIKRTEHQSEPFKVAVVESLSRVSRATNADVVFVCDAKSALLHSNADRTLFRHMSPEQLTNKLSKLLQVKKLKSMKLEIHEPTLREVVDEVTTKSVLTDVQTLVNKITPYDLRKKAHKLIISYFYGDLPWAKLNHFLSSASKFDLLRSALKQNGSAEKIRTAVLEYRETKDEEKASKKYGVHTFEILYVYNSFSKLSE